MQDDAFKYNKKESTIKSCLLSRDDLKKICIMLEKKTAESVKMQKDDIEKLENFDLENKTKFKTSVDKTLLLTVSIGGTNGELLAGHNSSIFDSDEFPTETTFITLDCINAFKLLNNFEPNNWFSLNIAFSPPTILDFSSQPEPTIKGFSWIRVNGINQTWVNGVFSDIKQHFDGNKSNREWLYAKSLYDFLLVIINFPLAFWLAYRSDTILKITQKKIPTILQAGFFVVEILIILYALRILFNCVRWLFPYIEFYNEKNRIRKIGRGIFWWAGGVIGSCILIDILSRIF